MEWMTNFWDMYSEIIIRFGIRIGLIFLIIFSSNIVRKVVKKSLHTAHKKYERLDQTLLPVLLSMADYFIYGIVIVIILDLFGVNTTSIIALMGAAGVAIGLALKDTLGNIASGIMLLFLRPFKVTDFVECASISGTVEKIDLFTTHFRTVDGIFIAAPNSTIFASAIKNYSRNPYRRMSLEVGISYSDSIEKGMEVLYSIAKSDSRIEQKGDNAPSVLLSNMGDSAITLQLRVWTETDLFWDVYWDTNKKIKKEIEAAGLTIPFPQRTLHLIQEKAM